MAKTTDDVIIPIKTERIIKEQAATLFASRGLSMTAGINMILRELISKKTMTVSFGDDTAEPLNQGEKKEMATMKNLSSFLDSIPG